MRPVSVCPRTQAKSNGSLPAEQYAAAAAYFDEREHAARFYRGMSSLELPRARELAVPSAKAANKSESTAQNAGDADTAAEELEAKVAELNALKAKSVQAWRSGDAGTAAQLKLEVRHCLCLVSPLPSWLRLRLSCGPHHVPHQVVELQKRLHRSLFTAQRQPAPSNSNRSSPTRRPTTVAYLAGPRATGSPQPSRRQWFAADPRARHRLLSRRFSATERELGRQAADPTVGGLRVSRPFFLSGRPPVGWRKYRPRPAVHTR